MTSVAFELQLRSERPGVPSAKNSEAVWVTRGRGECQLFARLQTFIPEMSASGMGRVRSAISAEQTAHASASA
jgi:hypothetical protein